MADGLFVGGRYAPSSNTVMTIAIKNMTYYYCSIAYGSSRLWELVSPHTRTDMPLAAPVILAYWSDDD